MKPTTHVHAAALAALLLLATGCAGGKLSLRSAENPVQELVGRFTTSVYGYGDNNTLHVLLLEGDEANPTQAVHLTMHWVPRAARTPIDQSATNATIRYILFSGEGAGVYGGGGFLYPTSTPGTGTLSAQLRNSSLRLQDKSEGFEDALGLASATGGFRAKRDDLRALRLVRTIEVRLHERLGYPRLVGRD